jgi:hypothetical protein
MFSEASVKRNVLFVTVAGYCDKKKLKSPELDDKVQSPSNP